MRTHAHHSKNVQITIDPLLNMLDLDPTKTKCNFCQWLAISYSNDHISYINIFLHVLVSC